MLMGVSSYIIYIAEANGGEKLLLKNKSLLLYVVQLIFNFFWSIFFFKLAMYKFAFVWLVILWILVFLYIKNAFKLNIIASYLMIPYLMWMSFAGYLNIMIAILY